MPPRLRELQERSGASFAQFFLVELPAHYGDLEREWAAVRRHCGLIDGRWRALLRVTGCDRVDFLHGMLTADVRRLAAGAGAHAAHLTAQGRVVADMRVLVLADEIWLDVPAQRRKILRQAFERYLVADDVELVADDLVALLLSLEGPRSPDVAAGVFARLPADVAPLSHVEVEAGGARFRVLAASHTGERGFLVFGRPDAAASLWQLCERAGATPTGMEALDALRIEAGIPWCDRDMDESVLAPEVGLESAISFTKGCYIGQEVVERVAARGQVQRRLMRLGCDGPSIPAPGTRLMCDGVEVGTITSAAPSFVRGGAVALAFVRRAAWEPGTVVEVGSGGRGIVMPLQP